jgi:Pirin
MRTSSIARPGVNIRRGADRHQTRIGWLHGRHSFDTGIDPLGADTHHGVLVVSNHDTIAPRSGFEAHPHRNMEIVTWVLNGSLVHQDSEGHAGVIYPGSCSEPTSPTKTGTSSSARSTTSTTPRSTPAPPGPSSTRAPAPCSASDRNTRELSPSGRIHLSPLEDSCLCLVRPAAPPPASRPALCQRSRSARSGSEGPGTARCNWPVHGPSMRRLTGHRRSACSAPRSPRSSSPTGSPEPSRPGSAATR